MRLDRSTLAAVAVCTGLVTARLFAQTPPEAALALARFRASPDSTLVLGFLHLPAAAREPGCRVSILLTDAREQVVWDTTWSQLAIPEKSDVAVFDVRVGAGTYRMTAAVEDLGRGTTRRVMTDIAALPEEAAVSDLIVANGSRPGEKEAPAARLHFGDVALVNPGWPYLTAGAAMLETYLQVYETTAASGGDSLWMWVEDTTGTPRYSSAASPVVRGGRASTLDLRALAPGWYRLAVELRGSGRAPLVRSAEFWILKPEETTPANLPADMFSRAGEARLDSLYAPLFYLMNKDERGVYSLLSVEQKRAYLRKFWARRNPAPGGGRNEAAEQFYARIDSANRAFREGGAAEIPGWRTDRGRIFILNGVPDEVLSRPQPASTQPYEVWKYTRGKLRKYVFFDLTGFGNYVLIYTTDIHEVSRPNWWELLGREAMEDVLRF
jgi:GWxTD domain-containing protein